MEPNNGTVSKITELETKLEKANSTISGLVQENLILKTQLKKTIELNIALCEATERCEANIRNELKHDEMLREKLNEKDSEICRLKKEIISTNLMLDLNKRNLDTLVDEVHILVEKCEVKQEEFNTIELHCKNLEDANKELAVKNNRLTDDNVMLKCRLDSLHTYHLHNTYRTGTRERSTSPSKKRRRFTKEIGASKESLNEILFDTQGMYTECSSVPCVTLHEATEKYKTTKKELDLKERDLNKLIDAAYILVEKCEKKQEEFNKIELNNKKLTAENNRLTNYVTLQYQLDEIYHGFSRDDETLRVSNSSDEFPLHSSSISRSSSLESFYGFPAIGDNTYQADDSKTYAADDHANDSKLDNENEVFETSRDSTSSEDSSMKLKPLSQYGNRPDTASNLS